MFYLSSADLGGNKKKIGGTSRGSHCMVQSTIQKQNAHHIQTYC